MASPSGSDFYDGDSLHVRSYDSLHPPTLEAIRNDVAFYSEVIGAAPARVLEIGCGTGRVGLALAAGGLAVTGLDSSAGMLKLAREKAKAQGLEPLAAFQLGDMRAFDLGETFSHVIVPFRAFQLMCSQEDQREALACFRVHLEADGILVLHLFDPDLNFLVPGGPVPGDNREGRDVKTGQKVEAVHNGVTFDYLSQVRTDLWDYRRLDENGKAVETEQLELAVRWCFRAEMELLFELEGFEPIAQYSDFEKSPPEYGKEQIWVCRKA